MKPPTPTDIPVLTIPDECWHDHGQNNAMWATVQLNGTLCHATAIEVEEVNPGGEWEPADAEWASTLDAYYQAAGADGPMETTTIFGRAWLIFIEPFS